MNNHTVCKDTLSLVQQQRDQAIGRVNVLSDENDDLRARAEKAERERDEARRERGEALDRLCEASRPLTPDAITDDMVKRGKEAYRKTGRYISSRSVHLILRAALTEPVARPEGAEDVAVRLFQAGTAVGVHMTAEQRDELADHLAAMHVRFVGGR